MASFAAIYTMTDASKRLIESAQQALEFAKGNAPAEDYRVHIPDEIDVKNSI
jgi:hypothetical protein